MSLPHELGDISKHPIVVLLVDDSRLIAETVRRLLVGEDDIRFHYCSDPRAAVETGIAVSPTVILQDLVMPQMDGMTLVRHFRASPQTCDVPLIVLSTEENPQVKAEAFACGANDYIVKLPDRLELLARIRYHSRGYTALVQRNQVFQALIESRRQLERRNQFIREAFGRYLSDEVVNSLLETPEGLQLGGSKREVSILMTDLRGFTAMTESLTPEQVVLIINNYLEVMTEVIGRFEGTINEVVGDGILVVFGAPLFREDHATRAVACAISMQLAVDSVNERNRRDGLPDIAMGIGINTGEVVVGNIGSSKRTKYAIIGNHVNLTARIESYTVGGQVMISRSTRDSVGDILEISRQDTVTAKGFRDPITIYEIIGLRGPYDVHLPQGHRPPVVLSVPLPVRYVPIVDKQVAGPWQEGDLVAVSESELMMRTDLPLEGFTSIRIEPCQVTSPESACEIYANVSVSSVTQPGTLHLRISSLSRDASLLIRSLLAG